VPLLMVVMKGSRPCCVLLLLVEGGVDRQRIDLNCCCGGASLTLRVRRRTGTSFYVIQRIPMISGPCCRCGGSVVIVPGAIVVRDTRIIVSSIVKSGDTQWHCRFKVKGQELVGEGPRCLPRCHGPFFAVVVCLLLSGVFPPCV
jgi:hypothetical protein